MGEKVIATAFLSALKWSAPVAAVALIALAVRKLMAQSGDMASSKQATDDASNQTRIQDAEKEADSGNTKDLDTLP